MNYFPTKPGIQLITDMINDRFGTSYTASQIAFGTPGATTSEGRNTEVTVGVTTGPLVNQITKVLYNRLNLATLFQNYAREIPDDNQFANVSDVLSHIQSNFNIVIEPSDIVDAAIAPGAYPRAFTIQASPGSYSFVGSTTFDLIAGAAPAEQWVATFSANVNLASEFGDGEFLFMTPDGQSVPGEFMYVAEFLNVGGGWGRYLIGLRFTPITTSDLAPSNDDFITLNIGPGEFWALDVVALNDSRPTPEPFTAQELPFGGGPFELRMKVEIDEHPPVVFAGVAAGATFRWRVVDGFGYADVEYVTTEDISGGRQAVTSVQARFHEAFLASQVIGETTTADGILLGEIKVSFSLVNPGTGIALVEMPSPFVATIAEGDGGEGANPNAWTVTKFDNSIFGNTTATGVNDILHMTPNGEVVNGKAFSRIEHHDQRQVPAPFGRYVTGVRFSTTPVPTDPVLSTVTGQNLESVYNFALSTTDTPWAIDITVENDFNQTQADPFNGAVNGFEYGLTINPDGLGLFPMRAVMVDNAGTKTIEIRRAANNALVKVADRVSFGAPGTPQEGNIIGFQVRFPHEMLLSWFPAVEKTSADVPYGFWNCRIEFFATGQWDLPPFTIPFFDTQANIAAP